ncbi:hypothetical protein GF342_00845 [Candidatus Woesearchaeota archaeon]|nr:hypothetical protein [Candidatus Woesearchaeota archaeon]
MIINELIKNFKLIFRNWSSLLLLILGPLAIILIIGLTFSGGDPHSIVIGVNDKGEFSKQLTSFATIVAYDDTDRCVQDMQHARVHLCIEAETKGKDLLAQGKVRFLYDESRKKLSNLLVAEIREVLGKSAEDISIAATTTILDQIQELVVFLSDKQTDIDAFVDEAKLTREQLVERGERLATLHAEFVPKYNEIKTIQQRLNNATDNSNQSVQSVLDEIRQTRQSLHDLMAVVNDSLQLTGFSLPLVSYNLTNSSAQLFFQNGTALLNRSTNSSLIASAIVAHSAATLDGELDVLANTTNATYDELLGAKKQIDDAVAVLDQAKVLLDEELAFNNEAIRRIDSSVARLEQVKDELQEGINELIIYDPSLAELLVKPILEEFDVVKPFRNVQIVFPGLVVMVLVFITLLFATILTLSEVNAAAYFRNLIAPVSSLWYPLGILLTNIVLVLFQLTVLLVIAEFQLGIPVFSHAGEVYGLATLLIILFSALGMSIALYVRSEQTAVLATTFFALGSYLFSDLLTPLELMPKGVAQVAAFNPVVITGELFRTLFAYQIPLSELALIVLGVYTFFALVLLVIMHYRHIARKK